MELGSKTMELANISDDESSHNDESSHDDESDSETSQTSDYIY
jgi:hypothetical protein